MFFNFIIGSCLIILTGIIHTLTTKIVFDFITKKGKTRTPFEQIIHIDIIILFIILATLVESSVWGISYQLIGAIGSFEEALYFSLVTFATLGYGDIVLSEEFWLLSALEAANGVIMFGWSTAILVSTLQRVYARPNSPE